MRANGQVVKPFSQKNGEIVDLNDHVNTCGANNFFYQNGTIAFVVTGENCQVRLRLTDFIQLSTRVDTTVEDFYSDDGETTYINNICAFLGIDPGRFKIVSVQEGSVIITSIIQEELEDENNSTNSTNSTNNTNTSDLSLDQLLVKLNEGLANDSIDLGAPLISYEAQI